MLSTISPPSATPAPSLPSFVPTTHAYPLEELPAVEAAHTRVRDVFRLLLVHWHHHRDKHAYRRGSKTATKYRPLTDEISTRTGYE
ncbi:hypothetical protein BC936DRAFT_145506 [Jimgerdemannia flammicorona]|uniref:Uncharacterized protein n=1 Tax=Jimgerdemannia flammicorona TaxID=994334 RepID=A0A433DAJ3_9FUNG|nr:hypothetical protein BC936DRAFT_145506 [Jimgerdemannia flammicorona]